MKPCFVILATVIHGRLDIYDEDEPKEKGLSATNQEKAVTAVCCDTIESYAYGRSSTWKRENEEVNVWVNDDKQRIIFNYYFNIWQIVEEGDHTSMGSAFTSTNNVKCPVYNTWSVQNKNSWKEITDFLQCQDRDEKDKNAYELATKVCEMLRVHMFDAGSHQIERRVNNLCQRALNIAKRTIRQRKCSVAPMARRTSLIEAIDTVRQWRDTLLSINEERNEGCLKIKTPLEEAIKNYYQTILRVFSKQEWVLD